MSVACTAYNAVQYNTASSVLSILWGTLEADDTRARIAHQWTTPSDQ